MGDIQHFVTPQVEIKTPVNPESVIADPVDGRAKLGRKVGARDYQLKLEKGIVPDPFHEPAEEAILCAAGSDYADFLHQISSSFR